MFMIIIIQANSSPNSSSSSNENSPQSQPVTIQTQSGQTLQLIPQQITLGSKNIMISKYLKYHLAEK